MTRARALGSFDGVQRGHQALLAATVAAARRAGLQEKWRSAARPWWDR